MSDYPVPLVLTCTVTGKQVKYYSRPYIEQRIQRAGSLEVLVNTFMTKGAKKKDAAPVSKPTIAPVAQPSTTKREVVERVVELTVSKTEDAVSCLVCVEK